MTDFNNALDITASAMRAQAGRIRMLSENIANADTPGYHRKMAPFRLDDGLVEMGTVRLDTHDAPLVFDPSHPMADSTGHYQGSNVDLMVEIADSREAQRSYQANLKMFEQTRKMQSELMQLLRR